MTHVDPDRPDAHRLELLRSVFEPSSLDEVAEAVAVASEHERRVYVERVEGGYRWSLTHPSGCEHDVRHGRNSTPTTRRSWTFRLEIREVVALSGQRPQSERGPRNKGLIVDWKLELVVVPVSDVDRAKAFYVEKVGFNLDVDHRAGDDFRVVQLTPPDSACSITIMKNTEAPGSLQALHLVVSDIKMARAELVERGADVSEIFHFDQGTQVPGSDPERSDYGSFFSFSDPDGNSWMVQEVKARTR